MTQSRQTLCGMLILLSLMVFSCSPTSPPSRVVAPVIDEGLKEIESCGPQWQEDSSDYRRFPNEDFNASIVQLLAHRSRYHGKEVRIEGFLTVRFEDHAIYLSKEDAEYGLTSNGFWVSFDEEAIPFTGVGPTQFHGKYVMIEGVFNEENRGHGSLWQGAIEDVDRVVERKPSDL